MAIEWTMLAPTKSATTQSSPPAQPALKFLLRALAYCVLFFGLLRVGWVEEQLLLPFTHLQKGIADLLGGPGPMAVTVGLSCSGTDVMALLLGVILAYPASWRRRFTGGLGGLILIVSLNTVRIGTLSQAAGSRSLFNLLHVYVWPGVLILATVGYVFWWMSSLSGRESRDEAPARPRPARPFVFSWRFALCLLVCILLFVGTSSWYLSSKGVLQAAFLVARSAAAIMGGFGASVQVSGNVLKTGRGVFLVTQECIVTPLIPLYLAVVLAAPMRWPRKLLAIVLCIPLFFLFGVARLLVLCVPQAVAPSPMFLVHAFFQIVLGVTLVVTVVSWRHGLSRSRWPATLRSLLPALAAGFVLVALGSRVYHLLVSGAALWLRSLLSAGPVDPALPADPQGALMLLPMFQTALFVALWIGAFPKLAKSRLVLGCLILFAFQLVLLAGLGILGQQAGFELHARYVRALAIALPVLAAFGLSRFRCGVRAPTEAGGSGSADRASDEARYRSFWSDVGEGFPDLAGAASTQMYFENERRLLTEHLPDLKNLRLLKTDLWDEAKNTRILNWAGRQGASCTGIDISLPIVRQALSGADEGAFLAAVADVRAFPFADQSFDAIYSMGTIEHFPSCEHTLQEMNRVLKDGGRLILGVPNRHDPFLRPVLVAVLQAMGLYAYGHENSFSRGRLNTMLESYGFEVEAESGVLFMPGWLRMLDLACHVWCRPLGFVTGLFVRGFALLDRHIPMVRRHGYLIASTGVKRSSSSR